MAMLQTATGPINNFEARQIEKKMSFNYKTAIGELTYAFAISRHDIGYAVSILASQNSTPAECPTEKATLEGKQP